MPRNLVSREKFAELAASGAAPADTGLLKGFFAEVKAADEAKRTLEFTISTASIDRYGDTVAVDGWDLKAYKKNPVVLWAHDYTGLPVARSVEVWTEKDSLKSVAEFVPREISEFSDRVYRLYGAGFLNATSVGFNPKKWAFVDDKDRKYGIDFIEQELLEYSAVPVPANPEALISAKSAGIDVAPITAWALDVLKANAPATVNDIRSFETFLRDVGGFSRSEAKAVASHGWKALDAQREAEAAIPAFQALLAAMQKQISF